MSIESTKSKIDSIPIAPVVSIVSPRIAGEQIMIVVKCPFCKKYHRHGAGNSLQEALLHFGVKLSHCETQESRSYNVQEDHRETTYNKPDYMKNYQRKYYHEKKKKSPSIQNKK
jgi:hypothetical protein